MKKLFSFSQNHPLSDAKGERIRNVPPPLAPWEQSSGFMCCSGLKCSVTISLVNYKENCLSGCVGEEKKDCKVTCSCMLLFACPLQSMQSSLDEIDRFPVSPQRLEDQPGLSVSS